MSYNKNTWQDSDYITTSDMNRIENDLEYLAGETGSSYTKTNWKNGDIVSASRLNNIEDGIEGIFNAIDLISTEAVLNDITPIDDNISITVNNTGKISATYRSNEDLNIINTPGVVNQNTTAHTDIYKNETYQLNTQKSSSIIPTKSQQVAVSSGKFTTGDVIIEAIPNQYIVPSGKKSITQNGTNIDVTEYEKVDVQIPSDIENQDKVVTPTNSVQEITADSGYSGLGTVTVNAMPTGTAGTPTATKSPVSNHSVTVTPSVTNTSGYITGGSKTGTAVSVSASELVDGTLNVISSGITDVTNYENVSIPEADYSFWYNNSEFYTDEQSGQQRKFKITYAFNCSEKGWISEKYNEIYSIYKAIPSNTIITPTKSVQTIGGSKYVLENALTINPIPNEYIIPSGNKSITSNGTNIDVANYETVSVNVEGGGGSTKYTATISTSSEHSVLGITFDGVNYYKDGDTFEYYGGESVTLKINGSSGGAYLYLDGVRVASSQDSISRTFILPESDILVQLTYSYSGSMYITRSTPKFTIETGSWTATEDTTQPTIEFSNNHNEPPAVVIFTDSSSTYDSTTPASYAFSYVDYYQLHSTALYSDSGILYGAVRTEYKTTSSGSLYGYSYDITNHYAESSTNTSYSRYYVNESWFKPYAGPKGTWKSGRTYTWKAIWR